ncbi:Rid family hydrolase [Desertimonas flava]|uniref:Rid family hydrolase n=1 Tax=Desertimonas flava TaxID=2064846 RepID=UPI000E349390|nr:Rid family hydrolase [Desertimonas flava]
MSSERYLDATEWQALAGYARAARTGCHIAVSGTTASAPDGSPLHPGDVYGQTREALTRSLAAVEALGGAVGDVIRTRVYLVPGADWKAAARAHQEMLGDVQPANTTLFVAALVGVGLLVEVEVEAVVGSADNDETAGQS